MSKPKDSDQKALRLLQIFSAKLVLEVFGGAGAIWGFSEAIGLRVPSSVWFWQPCALTFGAIFFGRWLSQVHDYVIDEGIQIDDKLKRLLQIFSAKLVLEVFGGAGAIWGFSEAIGLRTSSTLWFWRPCALTFGAIFFGRWLSQVNDYVVDENVKLINSAEKAASGDDDEQVALAPQQEKFYS